jgi:hypothetical protein
MEQGVILRLYKFAHIDPHVKNDARALADRVFELRDGMLVEKTC